MRPFALCLAAAAASAQELPVRVFDRADGLPNDQVRCLQEDRRGFLWIGTADGLCRFDGARFVRFGGADGLAQTNIDALAIGAGDDVYVGMTGPWFAHYAPAATPRLRSERVGSGAPGRNVNKIARAGDGRVFFTTESGVFVAAPGEAATAFACVHADPRRAWYGAVAALADGSVLYANSQVLVHFAAGGTSVWPRPDGRMLGNVWQVEPSGEHALLVEDGGVVDVGLSPWSVEPVVLPALGEAKPRALARDAHGDLWVGTTEGLLRARAGATAQARWVSRDAWVRTLACDREGNVWIGTDDQGLRCIAALPFEVVGPTPGIESRHSMQIAANGARVLVADDAGGLLEVEGDHLAAARGPPDLVGARGPFLVVDGAGAVWRGGPDGIVYAAGSERGAEALAGKDRRVPLGLRADRRGRVFCRTQSNELLLVTPDRERGPRISVSATPADCAPGPALGLDGRGRFLVGTDSGLCLITEGKTRSLCGADGRPLLARWLLEDHTGVWWLLARDRPGLARLRGLDSPVVDVRWFEREDGFPDGMLWSGAADHRGDLWFAGASGLTRFQVATGRADSLPWPGGLASGMIQGICVAADGRVYVSTRAGVVRFDPARLRPSGVPSTFIDELAIAGAPIPLADGGVATVAEFELPAARAEVALHLCAPGFRATPLRFQSRLLPLQTEFSTPRELAAVQLAGLAPGAHRLQIRAVTFDGIEGPPVEVRLHVLPPLWRRPLFLGALVAVGLGLVVLLHRFRVRRLLALESVRRQVATDLHDDLGSGLAQVAMLGEVAKRTASSERTGVLDEIAQLARGMRDSLGDIVWAVDPQRDELSALVHRLRHVAGNLFADETVTLQFTAPDDDTMTAARLPPDRRRNVFLIGKEALANCARHARARRVEVTITILGDSVRLVVADDGVGFDPSRKHAGAGLQSMARRAAMLGTTLAMQSALGAGTRIEVVARMR